MLVPPLSTSSIVIPRLAQAAGTRPLQEARARAGPAEPDEGESRATASNPAAQPPSPDGLTAEERSIVAQLARTDRQVRAHEQAHIAAAAGLVRGVSFTFVTGPDGKQYAVGGEVNIDTSPVAGDPAATIQKAQQIRAAANAPANPSGADRAVAAQASQLEQTARQELIAEQRQRLREQLERQSNGDLAPGAAGSSNAGRLFSLLA